MKHKTKLQIVGIVMWLVATSVISGCSLWLPSNSTMSNYKLDAVSTKRFVTRPVKPSLSVSQPTAAAGYQDNSMQYMQQNYAIATFAKHQWVAPPAEMLQPLLVQSIRNTGYFAAVVAAPTSGTTALRLETQLITLQQNFIRQPSQIELIAQVTLVNGRNNSVIASQRVMAQVAAPRDNPYGGVVAANIACEKIMRQIAAFVVRAS